jgi:hypothetical protein
MPNVSPGSTAAAGPRRVISGSSQVSANAATAIGTAMRNTVCSESA